MSQHRGVSVAVCGTEEDLTERLQLNLEGQVYFGRLFSVSKFSQILLIRLQF